MKEIWRSASSCGFNRYQCSNTEYIKDNECKEIKQ